MKNIKDINKKIVKIVKAGLMLIVICVNCVILVNGNDAVVKEKDACNFEYVEMIQNAASFDLR